MTIFGVTIPEIYQFYADNLRDSLFSGFLGLAGFLFSAKTFIVIHMKEKLYDSEAYAARLTKQQRINSKLTKYGPLRRLSSFLFWAVLSSLVAAVSQLTIGLIKAEWAAWSCLCFAVIAVLMLATSMFHVSANLKQWMVALEENDD